MITTMLDKMQVVKLYELANSLDHLTCVYFSAALVHSFDKASSVLVFAPPSHLQVHTS